MLKLNAFKKSYQIKTKTSSNPNQSATTEVL